jgi:hypothetical protein
MDACRRDLRILRRRANSRVLTMCDQHAIDIESACTRRVINV